MPSLDIYVPADIPMDIWQRIMRDTKQIASSQAWADASLRQPIINEDEIRLSAAGDADFFRLWRCGTSRSVYGQGMAILAIAAILAAARKRARLYLYVSGMSHADWRHALSSAIGLSLGRRLPIPVDHQPRRAGLIVPGQHVEYR